MKKIDCRFDENTVKMLNSFVGKTFDCFACDRLPNASATIYGAVTFFIENSKYSLTNFLETIDYINRRDDVGIFRLSLIDEKKYKELFEECEPIFTPVNQKISSIKLIDETQQLYQNNIVEYEILTVRGIVFILEDGREISFEKGIWFSEFIDVRTGYNLVESFASTNDFIDEWKESIYVPYISRNITVL